MSGGSGVTNRITETRVMDRWVGKPEMVLFTVNCFPLELHIAELDAHQNCCRPYSGRKALIWMKVCVGSAPHCNNLKRGKHHFHIQRFTLVLFPVASISGDSRDFPQYKLRFCLRDSISAVVTFNSFSSSPRDYPDNQNCIGLKCIYSPQA